MEKIVSFLGRNKFNIILLGLWLIVTSFALLNHEIWRDEAQAWCVVRDLGITDIFREAKIEGHPIFWYLLLLPFAKTGAPVISMQWLSMFFVFSGAVLLLFKSPFNGFQKIIILFSAGMLYFLPVVARNYSLVPVFLFSLAYLYKYRDKKPYIYSILIVFLSNTHLLMLGFCLILAGLFSVEQLKEFLKSKNIKLLLPVLILFLNFLIILFIFKDTSTENYVIQRYSQAGLGFIGVLSEFASNYSVPILKNFTFLNGVIFYLAICCVLCGLIKTDKKCALILFSGFAYFIWMFAKVWFGGVPYQKAYLFYLILVFCVWVVKSEGECNRLLNISFNILFLISLILSPLVVLGDISYNFSGAKQAAEYIKNNLSEEKTFVTVGYPYIYSSISAYLPDKKLYSYDLKQYVSYFNFTKSIKKQTELFQGEVKYYIVQEDFILPESEFRKVFEGNRENISSQKDREVFNIYVKEKTE